jgi:hypothetical protein
VSTEFRVSASADDGWRSELGGSFAQPEIPNAARAAIRQIPRFMLGVSLLFHWERP